MLPRATERSGPGTILRSCARVDVDPVSSVNVTKKIHNDLIPQNDQPSHQGTRVQKLEELMKRQNWQHLTGSEQIEVCQVILQHDPLFILDEKELGLINGPPPHIKVDDPRPSRGPRYRYPEQAKQLIAEMLDDMEQRDIIERSTATWLSPIVLVNKPDGSKRM